MSLFAQIINEHNFFRGYTPTLVKAYSASALGSLLEELDQMGCQKKASYHLLYYDFGPRDRIFYFTLEEISPSIGSF